jgi:hypothetical protein
LGLGNYFSSLTCPTISITLPCPTNATAMEGKGVWDHWVVLVSIVQKRFAQPKDLDVPFMQSNGHQVPGHIPSSFNGWTSSGFLRGLSLTCWEFASIRYAYFCMQIQLCTMKKHVQRAEACGAVVVSRVGDPAFLLGSEDEQ